MPDAIVTDPHDVDAEKSVLAACVLSADAVDEVCRELEPGTFYRCAHEFIFAAIRDLRGRGIPVDHISLADSLKARGQLEAVGGRAYLLELADDTFALTNWRYHVEIVRRTAMQRALIRAGAELKALGMDSPDDPEAVAEAAEALVARALAVPGSDASRHAGEGVWDAAGERARLYAESRGRVAGVPTGFADVDGLLHGLRPGELYVLAARPGMGKTALAANIAANAAKAGARVVFFSLEMPHEQVVDRMLCSEARVDLAHLRGGSMGAAEQTAFAGALERMRPLDLVWEDMPSATTADIRAAARRDLRRCDAGLVVVDYLQLVRPWDARKSDNRTTEVGRVSRDLKAAARALGAPVLALSQLSRAVESRDSRRPRLSDLRESGSIEQDADVVMFIDRSLDEREARRDDRPDWGTARLIVAKHRNGPVRDVGLSYMPEYTRFGDLSRR